MAFTIPGYGGIPQGGGVPDPNQGCGNCIPDPTQGYGGCVPVPDPSMGYDGYAPDSSQGYNGGLPVDNMPDPYAGGYAPYGVDAGYGYGAQQLQTPVQNPIGRIDRQGMVHYTKSQYIDGLRAYVMNASGLMISSEDAIEEYPQLLRHACAPAKISYLPVCYFNVPETGVRIPFYFCTACGKLFYMKDFL